MTLRKWFYLFWTSLLIGGIVAMIVGGTLLLADREFMEKLDGWAFVLNLVNMFGAGLMYSVLSQMGFFAFLTLNYIALSIVRRPGMWKVLQAALILIVVFDLIYLPYTSDRTDYGFWIYVLVPLLLLIFSVVVTFWKVSLTNRSAWVPTLFFMVVMTALEAVPVLRDYEVKAILDMMIPLAVVNAWQILRLHDLVRDSKSSSQ